jgi:hypothetical protein
MLKHVGNSACVFISDLALTSAHVYLLFFHTATESSGMQQQLRKVEFMLSDQSIDPKCLITDN